MTDLRDPQQFDRAYHEHAAAMLAAASRVLHDSAAAEDVVHDVFMHLWRKPSSYDPARGPLRSYLTMMARSRALDRWRTRAARDAAVERTKAEIRPESRDRRGRRRPRACAATAAGASCARWTSCRASSARPCCWPSARA